jgi:hypothetical protein
MVFRAPRFNDISDSTLFQELESSLWNQLSLAPNSVYISDVAITGNKYIEANVALFPLSGTYFTTDQVIKLGFDLNNQTFNAPDMFGPYYFLQYPYQLPGNFIISVIEKRIVFLLQTRSSYNVKMLFSTKILLQVLEVAVIRSAQL